MLWNFKINLEVFKSTNIESNFWLQSKFQEKVKYQNLCPLLGKIVMFSGGLGVRGSILNGLLSKHQEKKKIFDVFLLNTENEDPRKGVAPY